MSACSISHMGDGLAKKRSKHGKHCNKRQLSPKQRDKDIAKHLVMFTMRC